MQGKSDTFVHIAIGACSQIAEIVGVIVVVASGVIVPVNVITSTTEGHDAFKMPGSIIERRILRIND